MDTRERMPDIMTINEAAIYLRISPWTLRHWISDGKVTYLKYIEGAVRFRKTDLDRFILKNLRRKETTSNHEAGTEV